MRVALCLSGLMRTFAITYDSIYSYIIKPNNCDVFISTWDEVGNNYYKDEGSPWAYQRSPLEEKPLTEDHIRLVYQHNLCGVEIESNKPILESIGANLRETERKAPITVAHDPRNHQIVKRISLMHYKIKQCNNLRKNYELKNNFKYDVVIRCRPDLMFQKIVIVKCHPNLVVPRHNNYNLTNDQFGYSVGTTMDIYSGLFDKICDYHNSIASFVAENLLQYHLSKNGINVTKEDIPYSFQRGFISDMPEWTLVDLTWLVMDIPIIRTPWWKKWVNNLYKFFRRT